MKKIFQSIAMRADQVARMNIAGVVGEVVYLSSMKCHQCGDNGIAFVFCNCIECKAPVIRSVCASSYLRRARSGFTVNGDALTCIDCLAGRKGT